MSEEIDRWIDYMKKNPDTWKKVHSDFINAQFDKALSFMDRLSRQPGGKQKIIDAYKIKNFKGYERLLEGKGPAGLVKHSLR